MEIVLIHGQNHKGSSYHTGRLVAEKIRGENHITEFFLPRDLPHLCTGCCRCLEDEGKCPFYAEKRRIMDAVDRADLLIFTTPTYCMRASAPMKAFFELTFTYWMVHRPRACMFRKRALVISTAAGAGTRTAIRDVSNALTYWGIPCIKTYGVAVQSAGWEGVPDRIKRSINDAAERLAQTLSDPRPPRVGLKTRLLFSVMRGVQKRSEGASQSERAYWQEAGWLDNVRPWK